ncbi:MAG: hypothetical protein KDA21_05830, partial [Phycisphaerales bacterium]|nr:hypothetical protein [Phycisphaerales bacterium]
LLLGAGGFASEQLSTAQRDRWQKHFGARAAAARNRGQSATFEAAPSYYMMDNYFRSIRALAQDSRVWLTAFEHTTIEIDERDSEIGTTSFRPTVPEE